MRVTIRQKNIEITPALHTYIESKILRPVKKNIQGIVAGELPVLDLEFGRTSNHHHKGKVYHVAASLTFGKKLLRAEVDAEDMRSACDFLEAELGREIVSFKSRRRAIDRRGSRRVKKDLRFDPAARVYRRGRIRDEGN